MIEKMNTTTGLEIAVIGMSARVPGAGNINEFWDNLKSGEESISFFTDEELIDAGIPPELLKQPNYVKAKGALENIEYFDALFFDYRPVEAEKMDPQVRVFHECVWEALEDAGYNIESYDGLIGLYAGATSNYDWYRLSSSFAEGDAVENFASVQLNNKDYLATNISYKLNLNGPSFTLHTACSTSLLAIHLACQGILSGECDIGLAGGVSIWLPKKNGYLYYEGLIESPDGYCRAFDAEANGTVFGNGVGVVVLKSLEEAVADGDIIHTIIKGSAVNNDGNRKVGFTAPSTKGQAEVIRSALKVAEVDPESISYIETHGTGTSLGDPIEIEALKIAFNTGRKCFCRIGSVKPSVGHLDAAAGVTGFIKTVLALKHRLIPPSLHFETPNPRIEFENTPFYVNSKLTEWKNDKYPLRAGVSSFGVGGTNVHVILEEAPEIEESSGSREQKLFLLSAKTSSALDKITGNLAAHLKKNPGINLANAAYTLQVGRAAFKYRRMFVSSDVKEAIGALENLDSGKSQTFMARKGKPKVVFMFSGQGSQYVNMGLELYQKEPVFRETMDQCFDILKPIVDFDIKEILYPNKETTKTPNHQEITKEEGGEGSLTTSSEKINQTEITQPLLFVFEYALTKLLMHWGIKPYAMIGHSIGEYVAAFLSGVFSLEDALKLVTLRGRLMQKIPPGAMVSLQMTQEQLKPLLQVHHELSLAAVNGPGLCVISGPNEAIDKFEKEVLAQGHETRRLHTSHAFHSAMMEPVLTEFEEAVSRMVLNKPQIPYISNVSGNWINATEVKYPRYWSTHLRETIKFSYGLNELLKEKQTIFVEVGPGRVLTTFALKHPDKKQEQMMVNLVKHPQEKVSDSYYFFNKIGQLWLYGVTMDWQAFYCDEKRQRIGLPTYPFERRRYWKYMDNLLKNKNLQAESPIQKKKDISAWFYMPSWKRFAIPLDSTPAVGGTEQSSWLVFTDKYGVGAKLVEELETRGQDVVVVEMGPEFRKVSDSRFVLSTLEASDYTVLFDELNAIEKVPDAIVHLWAITREGQQEQEEKQEPEAVFIKKSLDIGFYSLLYLARVIGKHNITDKIRLAVVTDHMQEVTGQEDLRPEKAAVLGVVKVLPQEYPNINCRSIDVDLPAPGSPEENQLIGRLAAELFQESPDTVIAFRGSHRWVQTFEPVHIPPISIEEGAKKSSRLKEKGVYLITGGLGGIGLALAEHLAKHVRARLILTGRSTFPPRGQWEEWLTIYPPESTNMEAKKIRKLHKLEAYGAEVMVLRANVADEEDMQAVVTVAENQFGTIQGIIHAAGVLSGDTFLPVGEIGKTQCEEQFLSKIHGLLVLEKVMGERELDFCLLTSSLSAALGGLGYTAYAAANIFMDAFVCKHNRRSRVKWTSVNLDAWNTSEENGQPKTRETELDKMAMTASEGVEVMQRVLLWADGGVPHLVVSTADLQARIDQWIKLDSIREKETNQAEIEDSSCAHVQARPDLSTTYVTPSTRMEEIIANLWQKFLGIDKVGIHDNFFDLGATSLDIVQVNNKLKVALNRNIPVVRLFEFPTVGSLAQKLSSEETGENLAEKKKDRTVEMLKGRQSLQNRLQMRKQGEENVQSK